MNEFPPLTMNPTPLVIRPSSELARLRDAGEFVEVSEGEAIEEEKTLISLITASIKFLGMQIYNLIPVRGELPRDREKLINFLNAALSRHELAELDRPVRRKTTLRRPGLEFPTGSHRHNEKNRQRKVSGTHFTGETYWQPTERFNPMLEVTAGCSYNKCAFCTIYGVPFRASPIEDVQADLEEIRAARPRGVKRLWLVNGDPFALSADRLIEISRRAHATLAELKSLTCHASVRNLLKFSVDDCI